MTDNSSQSLTSRATGGVAGFTWYTWLLIGMATAVVAGLAVYNATAPVNHGAVTATPTGDTDAVTVDVTVDGMSFVPNSVDVPTGSALVVNFKNTGDMVHDLKIGDVETGRVNPGESVTLNVGPVTESIEGLCTIAGHAQMGMTFMVNAVGAGTGGDGGEKAASASAGHHHEATVPGVPSAAERMAPREGFAAFDATLPPARGKVHEYRWAMTEEVREVAPGVEQTRWLFDGQAPGPTLRGKVGDRFRITIVNEGSMGHSIDFHAGEVSPDAPMRTIQPGEELVYEFTANRAGAWMYHCATAPMSLHIANGMAGAVVIDPPDLGAVDAEYMLVAAEVFLGPDGADASRVAAGDYDLTAFNYYPNQYDVAPLRAKVGDTVRMWVVNVGPDQPLSFHVVGEQFDTVYSEGAYLLRDARDSGSQALALLPAQGGFVEMTFNEPGTYTFVNHVMTMAEKGQHGQIVVTG